MIVYVPKVSHNIFEISGYLLTTLHHIVHPVLHKYQLYLLISWPLVPAGATLLGWPNYGVDAGGCRLNKNPKSTELHTEVEGIKKVLVNVTL